MAVGDAAANPVLTESLLLTGARCADAADSDGADREQRVQVAYASGGLHLNVRRGVFAHQLEIGEGGSGGRITGGSFDPVCADLGADFAQANFGLIVKISIFKDHLDLCSAGVDGLCKSGRFFGPASKVLPDSAQPTVANRSLGGCFTKTFAHRERLAEQPATARFIGRRSESE